MHLIVGLGNPGAPYKGTRHNAGFEVVQGFAEKWKISISESVDQAKVGKGMCGKERVVVAMPQTSMNLSGDSVGRLMKRWRLSPSQLLLVCDDVSLPVGMIRLRAQGSDGGHNGLASVFQAAATAAIPRLRVGIGGRARGDLTPYVLGRFDRQEKKTFESGLAQAVKACEAWVTKGAASAMNLFNKRKK